MISIAKLGKELYLLAAGLLAYGTALLILSVWRTRNAFVAIMADLHEMPPAMRRLAVVQFFSWFALFAMGIYTTAAVTQVHYGATDPQSAIYNEGANWWASVASYSGFAAIRQWSSVWSGARLPSANDQTWRGLPAGIVRATRLALVIAAMVASASPGSIVSLLYACAKTCPPPDGSLPGHFIFSSLSTIAAAASRVGTASPRGNRSSLVLAWSLSLPAGSAVGRSRRERH